ASDSRPPPRPRTGTRAPTPRPARSGRVKEGLSPTRARGILRPRSPLRTPPRSQRPAPVPHTRLQGEEAVVLLVDGQASFGDSVRDMLGGERDIKFHFVSRAE